MHFSGRVSDDCVDCETWDPALIGEETTIVKILS